MNLDKIDSCRQVVDAEKYRTTFREMHVEYHFGKTGKGKTRSIMESHGYEDVYRVTDYLHPFDTYQGQPVIVFEEFHSNIKIQGVLNYLDGYPLMLPSRYNNKTACYTTVYITSNLKLEEQYRSIQREYWDTWEAFLRRIHKVRMFREHDIKNMRELTNIYGANMSLTVKLMRTALFVKKETYKQERLAGVDDDRRTKL